MLMAYVPSHSRSVLTQNHNWQARTVPKPVGTSSQPGGDGGFQFGHHLKEHSATGFNPPFCDPSLWIQVNNTFPRFKMVLTGTLLASLLAIISLSRVSPAAAFSGRFGISDLCVASSFQNDVTSTDNSSVSCRCCLLLTPPGELCPRLSLRRSHPAQAFPPCLTTMQFAFAD